MQPFYIAISAYEKYVSTSVREFSKWLLILEYSVYFNFKLMCTLFLVRIKISVSQCFLSAHCRLVFPFLKNVKYRFWNVIKHS